MLYQKTLHQQRTKIIQSSLTIPPCNHCPKHSTKKPRLTDSTTSETDSNHSVPNEEVNPGEEACNDMHAEPIEDQSSKSNRSTPKSRRTTLRDLASQKLVHEK